MPAHRPLPYKISTLVFIQNRSGELLLVKRAKAPNLGLWSPIGGKLEMDTGESPHECAVREMHEETGMEVETHDLHLFATIAEKSYEGGGHWLMFLFNCLRTCDRLPPPCGEGTFAFFPRRALDTLALPDTDRHALWPVWDEHRTGFVALRADCTPGNSLEVIHEEKPAGSGGLCP